MSDFLNTYAKPDDRKLKYHFEDLEGIVFGYKTSVEDKVRIMKVIEKKCDEIHRSDFVFYQAEPDTRTGKLRIARLDLLKLQPSKGG